MVYHEEQEEREEICIYCQKITTYKNKKDED